mgnify:FL=1
MGFKEAFVWGAATASYQNEGGYMEDGKGLSIWDTFSHQPGKIEDGRNGDVASDQYHRMDRDIAIMKEMGLNAYRFSLSWPRIMPDGTGRINPKGLDFYDRMVDRLLENGLEPYITLFHWDLPRELYLRGGWMNPDIPKWFAEYAQVVVDRLSDRVTCWITQNEPQCYIGQGLFSGNHAPGIRLAKKDALLAGHHSLLAHGHAVSAIRAYTKKKPVIGFVSDSGWLWVPETETQENIEACREKTFSADQQQLEGISWWLDPVFLGRYPEDGVEAVGGDMPFISLEDMQIISQPLDFLGVNIYRAEIGRADENGRCVTVERKKGYDRTAYPWAVVPESLYWGPKFLQERYGKEIIITENGLSNRDWVHLDGLVHDPQRIDFTHRYLKQLKRAVEEGLDAGGYFHWTLTDNFEWATGYSNRFGLVYVDFETQERIMKDSAYWYRDVIRCNGENI